MGLSKRLVPDQISFESAGSGGSSGWQAPEQLISRSGGVARQTNSGEPGGGWPRHACMHQARRGSQPPVACNPAVDVFSFGLLLHYCLTGGQHPFGELYERDANILQLRLNLKHVQHLPEAVNLVRGCCEPQGALLRLHSPATSCRGRAVGHHSCLPPQILPGDQPCPR